MGPCSLAPNAHTPLVVASGGQAEGAVSRGEHHHRAHPSEVVGVNIPVVPSGSRVPDRNSPVVVACGGQAGGAVSRGEHHHRAHPTRGQVPGVRESTHFGALAWGWCGASGWERVPSWSCLVISKAVARAVQVRRREGDRLIRDGC